MRSTLLLLTAALLVLASGCDSSEPATNGNSDDLRAACLDRPGIARPPAGQLPCELLPPGLTLP